MKHRISEKAEYIINRLEASGFEAFAVGGCVRDLILGREVNDYDITTSALPEETKKVFSSHPVIETGIKHGTVTVLIDRQPFEITTFRSESEYTDSRHPDSVSFVKDIVLDLSRRDFTINAVAYSPLKGIKDPFSGIDDMESRIIRAVGDPYQRFAEDALRILRALRFASVLGFELEESTKNAVFALSATLSKVSPERIFAELKKLLEGDFAQRVLEEYYPVFAQIIPMEGDYKSVGLLPADYSMRLACLCGKSVSEALRLLRSDNKTKSVCELLADSTPIPDDIPSLKEYVSLLGRENSRLVAIYRRALYGEDAESKIENLFQSGECVFQQDLEIKGSHLAELGFEGQEISVALRKLLAMVHRGEAENKKFLLLEKARELHIDIL